MRLVFALFALCLVSSATAGKKHMPSGQDIEDAWQKLVNPLSCEETCLKTCCRDGGGDACISACGCQGKSCNGVEVQGSCNTECRKICCRNGGGDACVTACGCPAGSCPHVEAKQLSCNTECRKICCRNGGGDACV